MSRTIFVNRYFFPDHSATSQILSDLAFHLAGAGRDVHVIASRQIYDEPNATLPGRDTINGVEVHRVASTRFGRTSLQGRAIDYLSFYRSARRCLGQIAQPDDVVVAKTDPPLLSVMIAPTVRARRARLVNWFQDIYPETARVLRVPFIRGPVAAALSALRNRSLWGSDATVVVGELMARRIEAFGVSAAQVHIIPNWCDDEKIIPILPADNPLRARWQLADKFVVGYSGNLGRAHEYETMLMAASQLRNEPRFVFLMIGGGKRFDDLIGAVKSRGLADSFRFQSYQDRATLPLSLAAPDVHWLSLKPQLEGLIVPSKFYGIAAAGRPIVMIGSHEGEIARLVRQHRCGINIVPGDVATLAGTLQQWSEDPPSTAEMGVRARQMLETKFARHLALARWSQLLDRLDRQASERTL
jgi:glycosyltransferase involved in cell wall biosynthesis